MRYGQVLSNGAVKGKDPLIWEKRQAVRIWVRCSSSLRSNFSGGRMGRRQGDLKEEGGTTAPLGNP